MIFVEPSEMGLRLTLGKYVTVLEPGYYFWWPIIQNFKNVTVVRQTVNLPSQFCQTKDGTTISVSGVVVYRIKDAYKVRCHAPVSKSR